MLFLRSCIRRSRLGVLFPLLLLWSGTASGEESIRFAMPDGWSEAQRENSNGNMVIEFLPEGESLKDWTQMITFLRMSKARNIPPQQFGNVILSGLARSCARKLTRSEMIKLPDRHHGGIVAIGLCEEMRSQGQPAQVLVKKIELVAMLVANGREGFYSVQRSWHGDTPSPDFPARNQAALSAWVQPLFNTALCPSPDPLCPAN